MHHLRVFLVLGLVIAVPACADDDSSSTTVEPAPPTSAPTTTPPATTGPTTPSTPGPSPTTEPTNAIEPTAPTEPTTTIDPTATAEPSATTAAATVPATEPPMVDVRVYLVSGERLTITHRQVPGPAVLRGALTELLSGPSTAEREAGFATAIPDGTSLLDVNLTDGTATVDLSDEYESGGGSSMMMARIAQVVFTATQFDNVDQIVFRMEGEPIEFLGGEGIVLDEPQTRSSTERSLTGGILFDAPAPGATVAGPVVVTGEGDVFEGDFPMVVRRDGVDVAGPFIVTAGAWGTWEDFEATILLDVTPGPIELVAWDATGCGPPECPPPTEVVIPLTLV